MSVKINRNSGNDPAKLVEQLVSGQAYPFQATLKHRNTFSLAVPSTGYPDIVAPNAVGQVRIRSYDQAWTLVTDLAQLADTANNDAEDYAVITPAIDTSSKKPGRKANTDNGAEAAETA